MALTFIGQSVASAIIGNLVNKCFSYLNAFPAASGKQDELDRLQKALPQVEAVLTAVEEGAWSAMMQNEGLRVWLWQLRDAVEDAEDVLDELEYYELEKRIRDGDDKPPFPNDVGQKNAADCFLKLDRLSIDHHALLLMEPLRSLSSISHFTLYDASRLTSLPEEWLLQNHSALKELEIKNACSLQSLPQSMTQLCSLERLLVRNAKLIQSLPDLPTSLRILRITGCHPELKERCQENIGLDWPKIANIPDVEIQLEIPVISYGIMQGQSGLFTLLLDDARAARLYRHLE